MPYPPRLRAHAEPSPVAYHVHCPACGTWSGGVVARAIAVDIWALTCPRCGSGAPGYVNPESVLPFGPYSGRAVSSLGTEAGRDYLDYLLHTLEPPAAGAPVPAQALRLAILWHLGWLSPERLSVAAGPDLERLRREWDQWQQRDDHAEAEAGLNEGERQQAEARARSQASWVRQMQAAQERSRGGRPRPPQQFHQYQRPVNPLPPLAASAPEQEPCPQWVGVLGVPWPVTAQQIRRAYLRLSKRCHPDVGGSHSAMQKINQARDEAEAWLGTARR